MAQTLWSNKRKRQYEHIKESQLERGSSTQKAEEIAARTVNKERAQHGESKTASALSLKDMPAPKRRGLYSHRGAQGRTFAQLYQEAKNKGITGRSKMNKMQLEQALDHH